MTTTKDNPCGRRGAVYSTRVHVGRRWLSGIGLGFVVVGLIGACGDDRPASTDASWRPWGPSVGVATGRCVEEGALRDCHIQLGSHDGIINCFLGQQECLSGEWTACGGDVRLTSRFSDPRGTPGGFGSGLKPLALGNACTDPCNPTCVSDGTDPEPNVTPDSVPLPGNFLEYDIPGSIPDGFLSKQTCEANCAVPSTCGPNATSHYNRFDACQADASCTELPSGSGNWQCVRNPYEWTWDDDVCAEGDGPDLTAGYSCRIRPGVITFPMCNRGNDPVPAGSVKIHFEGGNQYDWGTCAPATGSSTDTCLVTLSTALGPGECVQILDQPTTNPGEYHCAEWSTGNYVVMVNAGGEILECGKGQEGDGTATQPGCANNWTNVKKIPAGEIEDCTSMGVEYESKSLSEVYTATCPPGTWPVWESLYWDSIIGCDGTCDGINAESSITFGVQFGSEGAFEPPAPIVVAEIMDSNPALCDPGMTPDSTCPVKLHDLAGAQQPQIKLSITLNPTTPDPVAAPTLNSWQVTYSCPATE